MWPDLQTPSPITWRRHDGYDDCLIAGRIVAWLEPRPHYCDRGHWKVGSELPGLDGHDAFPRYYMRRDVAVQETEAWLRWRLWKQRDTPS